MSYAIIVNGLVSSVAKATPEYAAAKGWVELTGGAGVGWGYDGETFIPPLPQVVEVDREEAIEAVIVERERRLSLGFDFDFGDERGVHRIGTTARDMKGWDEVSKSATAAITLGMGNAPITIVSDTGPVELTPLKWQEILLAAGLQRTPIWMASFALQAMDPIPADFTNDAYWP